MTLMRNNAQANVVPQPHRPLADSGGFTLIEVLLAAAIIVLGMTGILTMQLVGIRITEDSYHRTKATTIAFQMTDYLRANCDASGPIKSQYASVTACRASSRHTGDQQTCEYDDLGDIATLQDSIVVADLQAWWSNLDNSDLDHWFAEIQTADDDVVRVAVQWDTNRVTEITDDLEAQSSEATGRTSCLDNGARVLAVGIEEVCLSTIPCRAD